MTLKISLVYVSLVDLKDQVTDSRSATLGCQRRHLKGISRMKTDSVLSRYNTADFDTKPVLALANLMGLSKPCIDEIKSSPSKYAPHLSGVVSTGISRNRNGPLWPELYF